MSKGLVYYGGYFYVFEWNFQVMSQPNYEHNRKYIALSVKTENAALGVYNHCEYAMLVAYTIFPTIFHLMIMFMHDMIVAVKYVNT